MYIIYDLKQLLLFHIYKSRWKESSKIIGKQNANSLETVVSLMLTSYLFYFLVVTQ